ncbi:MAG: type secretion system sortase PorU [Bacteroidota bacterium]
MIESAYSFFMRKKSGNNKFYLLVFMVLTTAVAVAQSYERKIDWLDKTKTFNTIDGKVITQPTFNKAAHSDQLGLLPVYSEVIPLQVSGNINVQITNAVYSISSHIDNTSLVYIKETIEPSADLSFLRKQPFASVSLLPFRKNAAGVVEKLESFTLRITVTPQPQHRSGNAYASTSKLAIGSFYKIAVSADGIYKIDFNFIKNVMKLDPASINLGTLAVYGNGGGMVPDQNSVARADDLLENPTMVVDNNGNNRMDDGDYLLFYGQMADKWKYNSSTQVYSHEKNLYTDKTFYFLTTDAGTGKRIAAFSTSDSPNKTITEFDEHIYHESDEYNLLSSGKRWLGDKMTSFSSSKEFSYNIPNLITSTPLKVISKIAASTTYGSSTIVKVNGQILFTQSIGGLPTSTDYPPASYGSLLSANYTAQSPTVVIGYNFTPAADPSGTASAYIDWFEILGKRSLVLSGDAMTFRSSSSTGSGSVSNFILGNAGSNTKVWDVTDIGNVSEMQGVLNGSQFSFVYPTADLREFIAFNTNGAFGNPELIGKVENQNLHALGQPDMLIITADEFVNPSNELAQFHRSMDNISVEVVKISQIYNEFGSGRPDISAIRDFVKMFYDRAGSDTALMPRYLLLMGDGTYDPKNRVPDNNNFISTYQSIESDSPTESYTSDDFFGLLDSNEGGDITGGGQLLDVGIGRLTAGSEQDAWDMVNKIKNYKRPVPSTNCVQISSNSSWRNIITFIADDQDGNVHLASSDVLAETTRQRQPSYNYEKIYLDAYKQLNTPAGDRYPDVNTAILNRINSGCLIINWVGHGGETNWAHERIFNMADIIPLANGEKLPMFITATCDFSRFDLPARTAGEWLVVNGKGGAIASLTTVRLVYSSGNAILNDAAFDYMFNEYEGRYPRLGEIIMLTKNATVSQGSNTRKFTLLGDPALTLNYPQHNVVTTSVNNNTILSADTLKALEEVTIRGEIRDENGNKLTGFNGTVYPMVYDKISTLQTLRNDPESVLTTFKMYKNILFKGKASVTNGDFIFSFIIPKDIDYQFGKGRISYYADNGNYVDAHGYTNDVVIGGSADSFRLDNAGPLMNIYMNDEKFVYGGTTNPDPMLLIKLSDESGINTVGNGIGHDLTAVLDDNTQNKVVLNEYYESALDNYKKGEVKYPYTKLAEGRHTLKAKAWDIQNNSTEEFTEFIVASNAKLALTHVYNYPNPFTTHTEFMFEHNRCCDDLNISVQIFTVSGKLVKSIVQQVHSQGYRVDDINWDGLDDYGDAIGKGVYVYKLTVRDGEGNTAHKYEKLVVLR